MKRLALFMALILVAQGAWAQQQSSGQGQEPPKPAAKPKPVDPADVETLTGRPQAGETEPAPKPGHPLNGEAAPKKGHPLDWRDVDILTGKADRGARQSYAPYVTPYVYADGPGYGSRFSTSTFGGSQFAPVNTRTSPLFVPRFGRFHDRSFFSFRTTTPFRSTFFFAPGAGRNSTLFVIP